MKLKFSYLFLFLIGSVSLLSAGCGSQQKNTLDRPSAQTNSEVSGKVAGAEIIELPTKIISINNINLEVELATTDVQMEHGLSGRDKLDDGNGMLFDFTNTNFKTPGFWMKDMLISIDIIWINDAGKIIGIEANAPLPPKDGDLPSYYPPSAIGYVLEVPAGWSAKNNVKVGTEVKL